MSSAIYWYKHDVSKFLSGTAHMSFAERGAYITLMNYQCDRGGYLPADEVAIFRMVGAINAEDQEVVRKVLAEKFELGEGGYANEKMLDTIRHAQEKSKKATKAAYAKHANADANADAHADANASAGARATRAGAICASDSYSSSVSESLKEDVSTDKNEREKRAQSLALPDALNREPFASTWAEWLSYRRKHRWPVKRPWAERQLAKLAHYGPEVASAALEQSMENGWKGVFPDKIAGDRKPATKPPPRYTCPICAEKFGEDVAYFGHVWDKHPEAAREYGWREPGTAE